MSFLVIFLLRWASIGWLCGAVFATNKFYVHELMVAQVLLSQHFSRRGTHLLPTTVIAITVIAT